MPFCKGCTKPIEWGLTEASGASIPLDPGTHENGNLKIIETTAAGAPVVRVVEPGSEPGLRMPHRATCSSPPKRRKSR